MGCCSPNLKQEQENEKELASDRSDFFKSESKHY